MHTIVVIDLRLMDELLKYTFMMQFLYYYPEYRKFSNGMYDLADNHRCTLSNL